MISVKLINYMSLVKGEVLLEPCDICGDRSKYFIQEGFSVDAVTIILSTLCKKHYMMKKLGGDV